MQVVSHHPTLMAAASGSSSESQNALNATNRQSRRVEELKFDLYLLARAIGYDEMGVVPDGMLKEEADGGIQFLEDRILRLTKVKEASENQSGHLKKYCHVNGHSKLSWYQKERA